MSTWKQVLVREREAEMKRLGHQVAFTHLMLFMHVTVSQGHQRLSHACQIPTDWNSRKIGC